MFTDPGNLQELCRYHHDMTTASLTRKKLTKLHGPMKTQKRKRRLTAEERREAKAKQEKERQVKFEKQEVERKASIEVLEERGVFYSMRKGRPSVRVTRKMFRRAARRKDEKAKKWFAVFETNGNRPLISLYPPDHWLHDPERYDANLSQEFEEDGYKWSGRGGAASEEMSY